MTTRDGTSTLLLYPSGIFFDPMNPDPAKIHVLDIAHHLAFIPRFGGGTAEPYSVAQHSVLVSQRIESLCARLRREVVSDVPLFDPRAPLFGLLHEVAEAVSGFGDVCAPIKRLPHVAAVVKPIERAIELAAASAWLFPDDFASCSIVKEADRFVLDWEDRDLRYEASGTYVAGGDNPSLPSEKIVPWPWREARERFLARYRELWASTGATGGH